MKNKFTSIVFTGDIGFDKHMDGKWEDEKLFSQAVLDFFHSADHICANVEGALYAVPKDEEHGNFFHAMNPAATKALQKIGADIWSIGNNHIMDARLPGMASTLDISKKMGCQTVGAGMNIEDASAPLYLEEAGGIGMIGVTYMNDCIPATENTPGIFRWDDMELIAKRIAEIKAKCRWCIVIAHGGEEFAAMPLPYTRKRYLKYLELGADVVVGHHPHVPENYELFDNGKAIFYSLGNFIFDTHYQRVHLYTDVGVLLKLNFSEERMDFEAIGIQINRGPETIDTAPLPDIFTDIPAEEFELLAPLSAKAFVEEEKRKMVFLKPQRFTDFTQKDWDTYFATETSSSYYAGAHQDFRTIVPYSRKAEECRWKESKLEKVKQYILRQFESKE